MLTPTHLLYLHGFRSSPQSAKARQTGERLANINARRSAAGEPRIQWLCPQLPPSPARAIDDVLRTLDVVEPARLALVGSSLGGFYATYLAHRLGCYAALLNPAVNPARDLCAQIGELTAWHDSSMSFAFTAEHVQELHALEVGDLSIAVPAPWRYMAVIARDDDVLDWREMAARYAGGQCHIVEQGGHALVNYAAQHLDAVLGFLGASTTS